MEKIRWREGGGGKTVRDPRWSRTLMPYFTVAPKQSPGDAKRPAGLLTGSIFRLTTRPDIHLILFAVSATFDPSSSSSSFPSFFFSLLLRNRIEPLCKRIGLLVLVTLMRQVECPWLFILERMARQVARNGQHRGARKISAINRECDRTRGSYFSFVVVDSFDSIVVIDKFGI